MGLSDFLSGGGLSTSSSASSSSPFVNNAGITFGDAGGVSGLTSDASATAQTDKTQLPQPLQGTAGSSLTPAASGTVAGINTTYLLIGAAIIVAVIILKKKHA